MSWDRKYEKVFETASAHCATRHEFLTVLLHLTAAALEQEIAALGLKAPKDTEFVTGYLLKITQMLDGHFDTGARRGKDWIAVGAPADPQTERIVRDVLTRDGGTVMDLGDAGRNDPCPCGSGKKFKRCHGAG